MLNEFRALVALSLRDPRSGIEAVLALGWPGNAIRMLALLVIIAEAVLNYLLAQATLVAVGPLASGNTPIMVAFLHIANMGPMPLLLRGLIAFVLYALLLHRAGTRFGGRGSMDACLLTVAWYYLLWSLFVGVAVVLTLITPFLTAFFFGLGSLWMLWILVNFVAGVHGFNALGPVFLGIIGGYLAVTLVLSFIPII